LQWGLCKQMAPVVFTFFASVFSNMKVPPLPLALAFNPANACRLQTGRHTLRVLHFSTPRF